MGRRRIDELSSCAGRSIRRRARIKRLVDGGVGVGEASNREFFLEAEYEDLKKRQPAPSGMVWCGRCEQMKSQGTSWLTFCADCVRFFRHLKSAGWDAELLEDAIEIAGGKCQICGDDCAAYFCCDHDHTTGAFRGVLCKSCNVLLGRYESALLNLDKIQRYLALPPIQPLRFDCIEILRCLEAADGGGMKKCFSNKVRNLRRYAKNDEDRQALGIEAVLAAWVRSQKKCEICGKDVPLYQKPGGTYAHWDHDHGTNRIRGVLCAWCNLMMGGYDWARSLGDTVDFYLGDLGVWDLHTSQEPRTICRGSYNNSVDKT